MLESGLIPAADPVAFAGHNEAVVRFKQLSIWEQANVLYELAPIIEKYVTQFAKFRAGLARAQERKDG
jgi:hypothetical protein